MQPSAANHIRIAHPSANFEQSLKFWTEGIGLRLLGHTDDSAEGGHALAFLGLPGAGWHLELVDTSEFASTPTVEDLIVIYLQSEIEGETIQRIEAAGGVRVASHNPYWDKCGITFQDPDGYLCVLSTQSWSNGTE